MSLFHKDCPIISVMSLFIIHSKLGYYNIVNNTNNYATETIPDFADMSKNWLHTNAGEIMAFLVLLFSWELYLKLPKISMYFCIDPRIYQVAVVFSRNQFFQLLKYLHVSAPTELPARDCPDYKLFRITPSIDTL